MADIELKGFKVIVLYETDLQNREKLYFELIAEVRNMGKSTLFLVPEISLVFPIFERLRAKFGKGIGIFHSRLKSSESLSEWRMMRKKGADIVVGTRSAIFAPLKNLGLIILDEEQDASYKQQEAPRYNAKEVALLRAKINKVPLILGTTAPSLESFYYVKKGRFKMFSLPQKEERKLSPEVKIINVGNRRGIMARGLIFSNLLENSISRSLANSERVLLFLNRRGFSTYASCRKCGYVLRCQRCNVSLIYHFDSQRLICHLCNYWVEPLEICPECHSSYVRYRGAGTQKVESEAHRLFPKASIARLDSDIMGRKAIETLKEFKEGKIDILIATRLVISCPDFPKVGLLGIISLDRMLNIPDFRATERTFCLLNQIIAKLKRGQSLKEVVIQTYTPNHYLLTAIARGDNQGFYNRELKLRRDLQLPPFRRLIQISCRGENEQRVKKVIFNLAKRIELNTKGFNITMLGPAKAHPYKLRGNFRWNILVKEKKLRSLSATLRNALKGMRRRSGVIVTIDVDPM